MHFKIRATSNDGPKKVYAIVSCVAASGTQYSTKLPPFVA
jgi:hypothetical protein